ncbi:MAG TPA: hypothetical protein VFB29_03150 [Pseudolabrys sp.]|nr:hypothetical protein [Pseudolabrys sp.]
MAQTSLRELKDNLQKLRTQVAEAERLAALRRRERMPCDMEHRLEAAPGHTGACRKAGFRPDQPRWPKGTEQGGRWSGGAGTPGDRDSVQTTELSAMRRKPPMPGLPLHLPHFSPGVGGNALSREPVTIINNAQTGLSTVDESTEKLRTILEKVVNGRPQSFGPEYGRAIHYDFANAVRSENLRGVGREGVEQTFGSDPDQRDVRYGTKGSIRTDVTLRNDSGDVIAIYDVKTGDARLGPRRVQELRNKTGASPGIPIIEMHIQRGLSLKARVEKGQYVWIITLSLWNPWVRASLTRSDRKIGRDA